MLTSATRPSTDGRAACRSPRRPRAAPTASAARSTRRAQLGLERQQPHEHPERRCQGRLEAARHRVFDRRADRQARWEQQAVLLLQPRVRAARAGERHAAVPRADRSSSGKATSRRPPTTTASRVPYIRDYHARRHVQRGQSGGLLRRRRRRRQDSGEPPLRDRLEHPEDVPDAEPHRRSGAGVQPGDRSADSRPRWRGSRQCAWTTSP